jgi:DNA polymerase-1
MIETVLRMIETSDLVALDLETTGLDPHEAALRLVQISNGPETYVIDSWSDEVPVERIFEALAMKSVIAHNAKFEWSWVYHLYGIELENVIDTYLMAKVLAAGDMTAEASLEALAAAELEIALDKEMQVSNWAAEHLDQRQIDYAALDAQVLLPLHTKLAGDIAEEGLERVAELENDALPAVARMALEGMPVDKAAWDAHAHEVEEEVRALERQMIEADWMPSRPSVSQIWQLQGADCLAMLKTAGVEVTGTTAKDLKDHQDHELVAALLEYRKAKGRERELAKDKVLELAPTKPSAPAPPWNLGSPQQVREICHKLTGEWFENTDEATLLEWLDVHPFFSLLLEHRKLKKRASTYGPGWFKDAYDENLGRVFPGWRQIGTSTGRFACSAPNAQNLPNDGPYRSFFIAPAGRTFVDVDYSQIEVRIIAKVLNEPVLLDLFGRGADLYYSTAAELLSSEEDEVTIEQRRLAKALVLGMLYGLSAHGLPTYAFKNYGIKMTPVEAENHVQSFYDLYPRLEAYHDAMRKELNTAGYVDQITLAGRRRDGITNRNEAINAPIQGAAADGLKMAMAEVHKRLRKFEGSAFIIAAIHDELLVECEEADSAEVLEIVKQAMVSTMHELVNAEEPVVPIMVEGLVTKVWSKG